MFLYIVTLIIKNIVSKINFLFYCKKYESFICATTKIYRVYVVLDG